MYFLSTRNICQLFMMMMRRGRVRMIGGLCPDVSNGPGYCKSFAVPTTLASSDGREIKSIQTIIPVNFPRAQWGMHRAIKQTASELLKQSQGPPGFNISPTLHTSSNKYLLCGDFVTQSPPICRNRVSKVRDMTNSQHFSLTKWFSHHLCLFFSLLIPLFIGSL